MTIQDLNYNKFYEKDIFGGVKDYPVTESSTLSNFEWDKGRGGIINIGGSDNSDGYIVVLDSKGNLKATINNRGLVLIGHTIIGTDPDGKETVHTLP